MVDHFVGRLYSNRVAQSHVTRIFLEAWSGSPALRRAAMIYAQGDAARAAACGGKLWKRFVEGDLAGVLSEVEGSTDPQLKYLEAEALIAAGAIIPGLRRLQPLHRRGEPAATLSLARRFHLLGDYHAAEEIAATMPWHAYIALIGARSALLAKRYPQARQLLEPFVSGMAPIPESTVANGLAVVTASLLAKLKEYTQLQNFARRLLLTNDLMEDILPAAARVAWIAGYGKEAWQRFHSKAEQDPWSAAACIELAVLAGNPDLAKSLAKKAGPIAAPALLPIPILDGSITKIDEHSQQLFSAGCKIHIWKTHPVRWEPWIKAALQTEAEIQVFNLSEGKIPEETDTPHVAVDDSSLPEVIMPVPVTQPKAYQLPLSNQQIWIEGELCEGVGVGFDWPIEETETVLQSFKRAAAPDQAAVKILSAESALALVHEGLPMVVIATPGDPFWAGPLPQQAWPNIRVVKYSTQTIWAESGKAVVAAVEQLTGQPEPLKPIEIKPAQSARPPSAQAPAKPKRVSKDTGKFSKKGAKVKATKKPKRSKK